MYDAILLIPLSGSYLIAPSSKGHLKSNVLGAVVRLWISASIQIPSAQIQVYYTARTLQLAVKGNY